MLTMDALPQSFDSDVRSGLRQGEAVQTQQLLELGLAPLDDVTWAVGLMEELVYDVD